jgi:two-component system, sensor histidine kinase LadS
MQLYKITILFITILIPLISISNNDTLFYFSESKILVNPYISFYKDKTNSLTINEIIEQKIFENDKGISSNNFSIKFDDDNYWLNYKLVNKNAYIKNIIFELANPGLDFVQLYIVNNGLVRQTPPTGDNLSFDTRQINTRNYAYEIALEPDETYDIYVKINCGNDAAKIPIYIFAQSTFTKKVQTENISFGIYYGIIIAIIFVLILSLLFKHKRKSLSFLILYIIFTVLLLLNIDGLGYQFIYSNIPWLANHSDIIGPVIAIFFIYNFIFDYIKLNILSANIYKFSRVFNYLILLLLPIVIFQLISIKLLIIITLFIGTFTIISIIYLLRYNYEYNPLETKVISVSFFCLFIVIVGLFLRIFTYGENFLLESILIKSGFLLQYGILTFALLVNLKTLQDKTQKEAVSNLLKLNELKEKSNRELDKVIKEKTKSLYEINQKFKKAIIQNSNITTSLHQQKLEITKQKEEIEKKNTEVELAFKEISNKNNLLEQKNEEIQSQSDEIVAQKNIIERRNKDITDSINYAQRIQAALFQSENYIQKFMKESFVFYQPKEIIGGDLYWFEEFPSTKYKQLVKDDHSKKLIIAAIDCTGHGVPGALMSIVARDLLDKAINEKGYSIPSDIINSMHQGIIETLRKDAEDEYISDGMDMTLCCIDRQTRIMQFSGAINPICIVRNGEITEIRGDRFSVGTYINEKTLNFSNNQFQLEKGDSIYLFTDGYSDQFGGDDLKKFKYKNFKRLLLEIQDKPLLIQKKILIERFNKWKNNVEQIDDVLVIGLKID